MKRAITNYLLKLVISCVFVCTVAFGEELQLTDNSHGDGSPQVHNGQVVWNGYDGADWEIFYWEGESVQQLTNNSHGDYKPQIHNGQVVWEGYDGLDNEIFCSDVRADLSLHLLQVTATGR